MIHTYKRQFGFSLIETAMVVMIVGLIMIPLLELYQTYTRNKQLDTTVNAIERVDLVLKSYFQSNGNFPCPDTNKDGLSDTCAGGATSSGTVPFATLNMKEKDITDGFGYALQYTVSNATTAAGSYNTTRSVDIRAIDMQNQGAAATPTATAVYALISTGKTGKGGVRIEGANGLACDAVDLDRENCNGDAIVHVTNRVIAGTPSAVAAQSTTVTIPGANMRVNSQRGNVIKVMPPKGMLGVAGVKTEIRRIISNTADTVTLDHRLDNAIAANSRAVITPDERNSRYSGNKLKILRATQHQMIAPIFDDYVFYRETVSDTPWIAADANGSVVTPAGEEIWLGFSESNPPIGAVFNSAAVEVNGAIKVTDNLDANRICTPGTAECFAPEVLGKGLITCTNDEEVMIGIANNQAVCAKPDIAMVDQNGNAIPMPQQCPAGLVFEGVGQCKRPTTIANNECAQIKVAVPCGTMEILPKSVAGVEWELGPGLPASPTKTKFVCQVNGSWIITGGAAQNGCASCKYNLGPVGQVISMACD